MLAACSSFAPPTPATLQALSANAVTPRPRQERVVVDLETPGLAGEFTGALQVVPATPVLVRLQLFPEVGGKLLDLRVDGDTIAGDFADGPPYRCGLPVGPATGPHPCLVLAVVLCEAFTPVVPARVTGERAGRDGLELRLVPAVGGGEVEVVVDAARRPLRWHCRYCGLRFTFTRDGVLSGPYLKGRFAFLTPIV